MHGGTHTQTPQTKIRGRDIDASSCPAPHTLANSYSGTPQRALPPLGLTSLCKGSGHVCPEYRQVLPKQSDSWTCLEPLHRAFLASSRLLPLFAHFLSILCCSLANLYSQPLPPPPLPLGRPLFLPRTAVALDVPGPHLFHVSLTRVCCGS